jgi:hypothetical protein
MLSLPIALQIALQAAPAASSAPEIVVTARHDRCFVEQGKHPLSDSELETLSQSWALGAPVRVIEPRGASLKCEFQIMRALAAHGQHVAQFVARSEDLSPEEERAEKAEIAAEQRKQAQRTTAVPPPLPPAALAQQPAILPPVLPPQSGRRRSPTGRSVAQAPSGIVTLACTIADPTQPYRLDVIVNEEKGTATPSRPDTGGGSEMKAVFMPDAVRFGPFTIDRVTLRIWRQGAGATQSAIVQGQCALADLRRVF